MPKTTKKQVKTAKKPLTEKEEVQKEIDVAAALEAVALSEGGKIIQESLVSDIITLIDSLSLRYKKATQLELVSMCADLKTKLDVLRSLTRAGKNKDFLIDQLGDALKE